MFNSREMCISTICGEARLQLDIIAIQSKIGGTAGLTWHMPFWVKWSSGRPLTGNNVVKGECVQLKTLLTDE